MFTAQPIALGRELTDLRAVVEWQDNLRQSIYASSPALAPLTLDSAVLDLLRRSAPPKLAWQVFDASAAATRVYALLEKAICELVEEYVLQISRLYPQYENLKESLRINHRVGVGHILSRWAPSKTLYSNLSEDIIAAGLTDGLRGSTYQLLSDAFLTDSDNYRSEVISRIFGRLGLNGAFDRAVKIADARPFCEKIESAGDTPASYLNRLVSERNEASHGSLGNVSSARQLIEYADFVEILVTCLATLLRTDVLNTGLATGAAREVAQAVKKYSGRIYGSRASIQTELRPGQVYLGGRGLIYELSIEELRIGPNPQASIATDIGTEFGMKLSRDLPEGSGLFTWI